METIGNDFAGNFTINTSSPRFTAASLYAVVARRSRRALTALCSVAASLKESWDAAGLRAAYIDRQLEKHKQEQALYFGRHRFFF